MLLLNYLHGDTLSYINSIRLHSGVNILKYSKTLAFAAKKHAIYLSINKEFGHSENRYKRNFYASMPWDRIAKANFGSKTVIENISFKEKNYKESIDKIMATIYHRLAFLDTKIDSLGYAKYNNIYVYDMGNSKISKLCKEKNKVIGTTIKNVCPKNKDLPLNLFKKAIDSVESLSKALIIYPYPNQKGVPRSLVNERPKFTYKNSCGLPISVTFNKHFYKTIKLKKFILTTKKRVVKTKIVTFRNDISKKIKKNTFVLLPLNRLKKETKYTVLLNATTDKKPIEYRWSFTTR